MARKAIELSYQAESHYLKANPDQKRRLLKTVLSNCYLKGRTLYPTYDKAFGILAEGIESNNKRGMWDSLRTYLASDWRVNNTFREIDSLLKK